MRYTVPFLGDPRVLPMSLGSAHQLVTQVAQEARTVRRRLRERLALHAARTRKKALVREQQAAALSVAADLSSAIADTHVRLQRCLDAKAGELLEVALRVAEEVVGLERSNPAATAARVQEELCKLRDARCQRIRCSPDDHELLSSSLASCGFPTQADPALTRGRVIIETPAGEVDLDPLRHLDELRGRLHECVDA